MHRWRTRRLSPGWPSSTTPCSRPAHRHHGGVRGRGQGWGWGVLGTLCPHSELHFGKDGRMKSLNACGV